MEDLEELNPQKKTIEMERWNISDLKDYISKLELEIEKAKKIIQKKENDVELVRIYFVSLYPLKYQTN